jgi:hypothetical protein
MSPVYDVYKHPSKGAWGVSVQGNCVQTAHVSDSGVVRGQIAPLKLAVEISRHLRMGYTKVSKPKYLWIDTQSEAGLGEFVETHPDLLSCGNALVFVSLSFDDDVQAIAQVIEDRLEEAKADLAASDKWVAALRASTDYLATTKSNPCFVLVLADWAIQAGRVVIASLPGMPIKRPAQAPMDWEIWLQTAGFTKTEARTALEQLGWSLRDVLLSNKPIEGKEINQMDDGGWLAAASLGSF